MKKGFFWVLAICIAFLVSVGVCTFSFYDNIRVFATNSSSQTLSDLQKQNDELNSALQKAKSSAADAKTQQTVYAEKIANLQSQIDAVNAQMRSYKKLIDSKNAQIQVLQDDIEKQTGKLKSIVKVLYVQGDSYFTDFLMKSKNFSEFLDNQVVIKKASDYYSGLASELSTKKKTLEQSKAELDDTYSKLTLAKGILDTQRKELEQCLTENQRLLQSLNGQQSFYLDNININNEYIKALDQKIINTTTTTKSTQPTESSSSSSTQSEDITTDVPEFNGIFVWPVPGYTYISSYWGDGRNHQGLDIAGVEIYGAEIVAAASGTVIASNADGSWGGGYGNYVVIDHGQTYSTLYGHMSEVIVSDGQTVSQGEVIGYVGSTGDSTGPHCHYEIRIDGQRVDPLDYYPNL